MIDEDDPAFRGLTAEKKDKKAENDIDEDEEDEAAFGEKDTLLSSDDFMDEETTWITSIHEEASMLYLCAMNVCAAKLSLMEIPVDAIRQGLQDQLDLYKVKKYIYVYLLKKTEMLWYLCPLFCSALKL
ncbi:hypothetical protein EON64_06995 [archaeon]|nr:MAG: hypothetical protein EON64_06995 [archaeon]